MHGLFRGEFWDLAVFQMSTILFSTCSSDGLGFDASCRHFTGPNDCGLRPTRGMSRIAVPPPGALIFDQFGVSVSIE